MGTQFSVLLKTLCIAPDLLAQEADVSLETMGRLCWSQEAARQVPLADIAQVFVALNRVTAGKACFPYAYQQADLLRDDYTVAEAQGLKRLREGDAVAYNPLTQTPIVLPTTRGRRRGRW